MPFLIWVQIIFESPKQFLFWLARSFEKVKEQFKRGSGNLEMSGQSSTCAVLVFMKQIFSQARLYLTHSNHDQGM